MKLRKKKILYGKQQSTTKKGEVYMGKAKRYILAICAAVLLVGAGTIIYRQAQGSESLWGTFAKDHKDLVKKYSDWFNKDGEFYFKIAEGKKDTAWWDKIFDKVANKEEGTKIPEELIKAMTTEQLLDACARHPLAFRFYADQEHAYLDWDTYVKKEFNGINALLKRKDIWDACYQLYMNTDIPKEKTEQEVGEIEIYKQCIAAGMLLSSKGYDQLTKKQRNMVIRKTYEKDKQVNKEEKYILFQHTFATSLISADADDNPWQKTKEAYDNAND